MASRPAGLLVALLVAVASPPAVAEDQKAAAETYFRAGERAYNVGQYLAAAQAFEEAYELLPVAAIAFSAAQAYRLQYFIDKQPQRLKRAVELYRRYLEQQKAGGRVPDAVRSLAELEPLLETMEREGRMTGMAPEAKTTRLMVVSQVDGAHGSIDGERGPLPLIKEVAAGEHTVAVEADGHFPVTIKATAVDGELIPVEVDLVARPAVLDIVAEDGARVAIDGRFAGNAPMRGLEVAAGDHLVSVSRRGRQPAGLDISLGRGERRKVSVELRATTQRKVAWWVLGAAGVLAVGAGVSGTVALIADGEASELDDRRRSSSLTVDELDRYDDQRQRRDDAVRATWITGGAAAAIGITGALMLVFDDPRAEAPAMSVDPARTRPAAPVVRPMASLDGMGIEVGGRF